MKFAISVVKCVKREERWRIKNVLRERRLNFFLALSPHKLDFSALTSIRFDL